MAQKKQIKHFVRPRSAVNRSLQLVKTFEEMMDHWADFDLMDTVDELRMSPIFREMWKDVADQRSVSLQDMLWFSARVYLAGRNSARLGGAE